MKTLNLSSHLSSWGIESSDLRLETRVKKMGVVVLCFINSLFDLQNKIKRKKKNKEWGDFFIVRYKRKSKERKNEVFFSLLDCIKNEKKNRNL